MKKDKRGFTLAEVLITLAIIGVVAALTIPSVIRNYQETQRKSAAKKAYSTFVRITNLIMQEILIVTTEVKVKIFAEPCILT